MILLSLKVQKRFLGAFSKGFRGLLSFDHCYYFSLGYNDKLNRNVDNVIKVIDKLNKIAAKMQDFEKHIFFSISWTTSGKSVLIHAPFVTLGEDESLLTSEKNLWSVEEKWHSVQRQLLICFPYFTLWDWNIHISRDLHILYI